MCVCVCLSVCLRACVRACVRFCVRVRVRVRVLNLFCSSFTVRGVTRLHIAGIRISASMLLSFLLRAYIDNQEVGIGCLSCCWE